MARKKQRKKLIDDPAPSVINIPNPLQVQIMPLQKQAPTRPIKLRRWGLWMVAFLLFATSGWLWYIYIFPQAAASNLGCGSSIPGLRVSVKYPAYLAIGDEGEIHISIANEVSNVLPITGTVLIEFQEPGSIQLAPGTSNAIRFEKLLPGEWRSVPLRFTINTPAILIADAHQQLDFALRAAGSTQICETGPWQISVAPLYRLRALLTTLWGSATITTLIGLMWTRIQKWLGYD